MSNVVIFGVKDTAELAHYYLTNDTNHSVVAFCIHSKYLESSENSFKGLPVVAFEDVDKFFPPQEFSFFAPMTGASMNKHRESVYLDAKAKGYKFISYVSTKATVLTDQIGENCFILEDNTIQPFVSVGNNVVMWSGNHIGHHSIIRDNVFFTSHVVLSGHCDVGKYCWFGVNATIRDFTKFPEGTLVAMGACITKSPQDEWAVYMGIPAKKLEGVDPIKVVK